MKKATFLTILIALLFYSFPACTLHIPYDWEIDASPYRIILKVAPDDAEVLLNGRLIGMAYEFSTPESAIKLASRNNELIIKRAGYLEETINLYEYSSHRITVRLNLIRDRDYRGPADSKTPPPPRPTRTPAPVEKPSKTDEAYKPKTEKPKEMPESTQFEEPATDVKPVDVVLAIFPDEAAIYLDGRFFGLSPKSGVIENLRLKPGKYVLSVVKPGYKDYKKTLYIADQKVKLTIKLEKQ